MKKISTMVLGLLTFASVNAQFNSKTDAEAFIYSEPAQLKNNLPSDAFRGAATCSDTNRWTWARSLQQNPNTGQIEASYFTFNLHNDSMSFKSYGTYVDVPANTTIDVAGFSFYGFSERADGAPVTVNAVIYQAGADSLPVGQALASIPVSLDTASFLNQMFKSAVFTTPVSLSSGFVLSIENSLTVGDSCSIIRGYTGSGAADNAPSVFQIDVLGPNYSRLNGFAEGLRLPHFYPFVSFSQTNDFTMSVASLSNDNETVDFTYEGPSISDHPIWSISGYIGDQTSFWNFDFATGYARDTAVTFADASIDHNITLTDSLAMFDGGTCVLSETKVLGKASPNSIAEMNTNALNAFVSNGNIVLNNATGVATIYTINGLVKAQVLVSNSYEVIDASAFTPGVYLVSVNNKVWKLKL